MLYYLCYIIVCYIILCWPAGGRGPQAGGSRGPAGFASGDFHTTHYDNCVYVYMYIYIYIIEREMMCVYIYIYIHTYTRYTSSCQGSCVTTPLPVRRPSCPPKAAQEAITNIYKIYVYIYIYIYIIVYLFIYLYM